MIELKLAQTSKLYLSCNKMSMIVMEINLQL